MKLNPKQQLFVVEYLKDKNATRAAKAAGYSEGVAHSTGPRLLENVGVKEAIQKGLEKQIKRRTEKFEMSKDEWMRELRLIGTANMDDFAKIKKIKVKHGKDDKEIEVFTVEAVATEDRARILGRCIRKISETKNGIGIELHSKQSALETIGKALGWVRNDVDLNLPKDGIQIVLTMPSNGSENNDDPKSE